MQMDFRSCELRFGVQDWSRFNAQEVENALKAEGFAGVAFKGRTS
jgi:hypothetical protein